MQQQQQHSARSAIPRPQTRYQRAGDANATGGSRPQLPAPSVSSQRPRKPPPPTPRNHSADGRYRASSSAGFARSDSGSGGRFVPTNDSVNAALGFSTCVAEEAGCVPGCRTFRGASSCSHRRSNSSSSPSHASSSRLQAPIRRSPPESPCGVAMASHPLVTAYNHVLRVAPPPVPPAMLRGLERRETSVLGKVKVMLRVAPTSGEQAETNSFLQVDARQKQLTIYEPPPSLVTGYMEERTIGVSAPKMFAFDAIFSPENSQAEVCSKSLVDVLPAVVNGSDGCLFTYGYSKLGKSYTMFGDGDTTQDLGVLPCAISWLFKLIGEQRQKTGARFSVRVSATEIAGKSEVLRDLLSSYSNGTEGCAFSPSMYLKEDPLFGLHLQNQCELRAPTAEKAAFYLDAALAASQAAAHENEGISHVIFTLHVYQHRVDNSGKGGVAGGRSRLYFVDLGGCEKQSQVYNHSRSYRMSLANLGNVILAIFNGQKHVPYKDSKLTQLLKGILGNITCRAAMIAHVSSLPNHYTESLGTIQLASRIHRLRHKKHKFNGNSGDDDQYGNPRRREDGLRSSSSDFDCTTSSSEQSCDTVIFVGKTLHEAVEEETSIQQRSHAGAAPAVAVVRPSYAQIRRMSNGPPPPVSGNGLQSFRSYTNTAGCNFPPFLPFNNNAIPEEVLENFARTNFGYASATMSTTGQQQVQYRPPANQDDTGLRKGPSPPHRTTRNGEFWVDGPGVSRNSVDGGRRMIGRQREQSSTNATTHVESNCETWVDGPQVSAPSSHAQTTTTTTAAIVGDQLSRYLDEQKRSMVERWISTVAARNPDDEDFVTTETESNDGDTMSAFNGSGGCLDLELVARMDKCCVDGNLLPLSPLRPTVELEAVSTVDSFVSSETEFDRGSRNGAAAPTVDDDLSDCPPSFRDVVVPEDGGEDFYRRVLMSAAPEQDGLSSCDGEVNVEAPLSDSGSYEGGADVPVVMMDSWVQVTEEEILWACRDLDNEYDEDDDEEDHPLRILSRESLAISFTNSSRRSWDSGLNAVRKAMAAVAATATRTSMCRGSDSEKSCAKFSVGSQCDMAGGDGLDDESPYLLDRLDLDYEVSSVHSDPGRTPTSRRRQRPMPRLGLPDRLYGSRSLENVSCSYEELDVTTSCGGFDCSCLYGELCDRCSIDRCPDGASDPHLDRHRSAYDVRPLVDDVTGDRENLESEETYCGERRTTNRVQSIVTDCEGANSVSPVHSKPNKAGAAKISHIPILVTSSVAVANNKKVTVAVGKRASEKRGEDGLIRISKTTAAFCCAVSGFRDTAPPVVTNNKSSELTRCKLVNLKNGGSRYRVSPVKQDVILPKDSFYLEEEAKPIVIGEPRITLNSFNCSSSGVYYNNHQVPKPQLPGPPTDHSTLSEDKRSYDSGTGSSGGSSTNGSSKEEPKIHSSVGTASSGYESMPRSSDGTCSLSNQDSVSLSSDETTSGVKGISTTCDGCTASTSTSAHSRDPVKHISQQLFERFPLKRYELEDVQRMERRRILEQDLDQRKRRMKIIKLRQKQEELRRELARSKSFLMIDSNKWSYDLYVEESMDSEDPSFLEALERETQILEKRVAACKSHIVMVTSFDVTTPSLVSRTPAQEIAASEPAETFNF